MAALTLLSLAANASPGLLPTASILISETNIDRLDSDPFIEQRRIYLQAEQALKNRSYRTLQRLSLQLEDYPLLPYLQYRNLTRQLGSLNKQQIQNFLQMNDQTLIGEKFRRKMIRHYARRKHWNDLIEIYQPQSSISLQCSYLNALIHTGKQTLAFDDASKLWLSPVSLPKSCDAVFSKWKQAGYQTNALTWQRIELTIKKGRTQLSRFLARSLSPVDRHWVNSWIKLRSHPHLATRLRLLKSEHPMASTIRLYAIKRLSNKDPEKAIALWQKLNQSHSFSEQQTQLAYRAIGLSMARKHQPDAYGWLSKIADQYHDKYSREWLIRTTIRHENWPQTVTAIENLPASEQSDLRWQFWWAYAQDQLGNNVDADGIFHHLSAHRSYYGFLAADHLNLPYAFEDIPVEFSKMEIGSISYNPAALRARELYKLGKILDARREWYSLILSLKNKRQKLAASKLAQQWLWHDRAIYTMGKTDYRDDIQLRFPLPMKDKVEAWSSKQSIEPALTYAIIRRESAFMADARSHMGALGLMQIQPRTARTVARNMHVKYRGKHSLLSADTNLKLGTGYLNQMLKRLNNQYALATAAYNAGPHRVQAWLPETQPMEAIRWIETIPFSETREYVSNVLAYTTIYQYLLHDQYTRLTSRMPQIPARNPVAEADIITKVALNDGR